jgi:hypothetical protein
MGRAHPDLLGTLLLGGGVVAVLLPLVEGDTGGVARWRWPSLTAIVLLVFFARWGMHTTRQGLPPLLDPQLAHTAGYPGGLLIGPRLIPLAVRRR